MSVGFLSSSIFKLKRKLPRVAPGEGNVHWKLFCFTAPAFEPGCPDDVLALELEGKEGLVEALGQLTAGEESYLGNLIAIDDLGEGGLKNAFLELRLACFEVSGPDPVGTFPALGDGEGLVGTNLDVNHSACIGWLPELAINHFAFLGDNVTFGLVGGDEDAFGGGQASGLDGGFLVEPSAGSPPSIDSFKLFPACGQSLGSADDDFVFDALCRESARQTASARVPLKRSVVKYILPSYSTSTLAPGMMTNKTGSLVGLSLVTIVMVPMVPSPSFKLLVTSPPVVRFRLSAGLQSAVG